MSSALVKGPSYGAYSLKFGLRFNSHMARPGNTCNKNVFSTFSQNNATFTVSPYISFSSASLMFSNSLIEHLNAIFLFRSITNAHG